MNEQFLKKTSNDYFKHHGLTKSPCYKCSNFCISNICPTIKCMVFQKKEWQKYFIPDAPKCPMFKNGDWQVDIID